MHGVITMDWPRLDWFPDWSGETAICLAGGPSASYVETLAALRMHGLRQLKARVRCIAVNESHRLAPWADALYAADYFWWLKNRGMSTFAGLRISQSEEAADAFPGIRHVELQRIADTVMDVRGHRSAAPGANSGHQALNLAAQFGARRIVLIGYDMTIDHGVHWHGLHGGGSQNPTRSTIAAWRAALDRAAPRFAAAGVEVLNASPISALTAYPKIRLEDVL